ncbi:hypothetical protein D3C78_1596700 [compost metagenome]
MHGYDTKQLHHAVREKLAELPRHSALRLRCDPNDVANGDIETFRREYPSFEWSVLVEKATKKKNSVMESLKNFDMSKFIPITKDTLLELIVQDLERQTSDVSTQQRCLERLRGFIN